MNIINLKGVIMEISSTVKIFTEGGRNIGFGHITRCISLYSEILKRGIKTKFVISGELNNVSMLKGIDYTNETWLHKEYLNNNLNENDYVIIDSYKIDKALCEYISNLSNKVIFIDDIGRIEYPEGIIVNPSLDATSINYSISPKRFLLTGPKYVILKPIYTTKFIKIIPKKIKRILVTLGGTDIRELTPFILKNIIKHFKNIRFDFVVGSIYSKEFFAEYKNIKTIHIHHNINSYKMFRLMINSDLAITAAGQTIYELMITKTPFIPIQVIENQENNVRSLLKFNSNQIILKYDSDNLREDLLSSLKFYYVLKNRLDHNKAYENVIDGLGSKRIIDELLEDKKVRL
jgi:UDP-2,4-diacetamido-2,4,6-trideoxy-beta-L-altropyranose hydrolase